MTRRSAFAAFSYVACAPVCPLILSCSIWNSFALCSNGSFLNAPFLWILRKGFVLFTVEHKSLWFCCCRQSVPNVETPDLLFVRHLCSQFQDFFLSWVCALAWCYRVDARPQFDLAPEEIFGNDCVDSSLKLMILFMILQSHQQINGD